MVNYSNRNNLPVTARTTSGSSGSFAALPPASVWVAR